MAITGDDNGNTRVTTGEIGRRLDRIEHDVGARFDAIDAKLSALHFVHPDVLDSKMELEKAHRQDAVRRIVDLEAENGRRRLEVTANRRLAISALLAPLLVALVSVLLYAAIVGKP